MFELLKIYNVFRAMKIKTQYRTERNVFPKKLLFQ